MARQEVAMLTVPEIARQLRVSQETIRRWLRTGQLHGVHLGDRAGWRVPASEIDRFLAQRAGQHGAHADENGR